MRPEDDDLARVYECLMPQVLGGQLHAATVAMATIRAVSACSAFHPWAKLRRPEYHDGQNGEGIPHLANGEGDNRGDEQDEDQHIQGLPAQDAIPGVTTNLLQAVRAEALRAPVRLLRGQPVL